MFDALSEKLNRTFARLRGHGKLSEADIEEAVRDVRLGFLEADVNYKVVREFVDRVKERAVGSEVSDSLTPGQQFVQIVHSELIRMLGEQSPGLDLRRKPPVVIMMVGLQGSGKTTSSGKLANLLRHDLRRIPYLVPADVQRPAAIEQLQTLGRQIGVPVHPTAPASDPVEVAVEAVREAGLRGLDTVIIDTAGRLHVDEDLMQELARMKAAVDPAEILLVADAMTGQEAVTIARSFHERLSLSGVVLTKMDGDARGGAALSIRAVTGAPVKFVGTGEKLDGLEPFHPDRMASRILGMGDMLSLIEKAQKSVDQEKAVELQRKFRKNEFSLEDFRDQLQQLNKLGSFEDVVKMIPGVSGMLRGIDGSREASLAEKELGRMVAIINSMTPRERVNHALLDGSRRRRIATGSGTSVQEVNRFMKQFLQMKKMMKKVNTLGLRGFMRMMRGGRLS